VERKHDPTFKNSTGLQMDFYAQSFGLKYQPHVSFEGKLAIREVGGRQKPLSIAAIAEVNKAITPVNHGS